MDFLRKIFHWYIHSSLHVGLATACLVMLTYQQLKTPYDAIIVAFVFFATVSSYNLTKFSKLIFVRKQKSVFLSNILFLTSVSMLFCAWVIPKFSLQSIVTLSFFTLLNFFYAFPLDGKKRNLRNHSTLKIYIVGLCWAGITLLLPVIHSEITINADVIFLFVHRFLFTLILLLIFEIKDLKNDHINLKTVPRKIGIKLTKYIIHILNLLLSVLSILFLFGNIFTHLTVFIFITVSVLFVEKIKTEYYTLFWVESLSIVFYLAYVVYL